MPLITTVILLKMVARHHTKLPCSKAFSTHLQHIFLHSQMATYHQSACMKLKPNTSRIIDILMGQPMGLVQLETFSPTDYYHSEILNTRPHEILEKPSPPQLPLPSFSTTNCDCKEDWLT
uniref:Uncharacterized protein n=1 Tax=Piliocolobus tephrosceles TaxID=591936 RepID=A0A8C9I1E0_9PRIM